MPILSLGASKTLRGRRWLRKSNQTALATPATLGRELVAHAPLPNELGDDLERLVEVPGARREVVPLHRRSLGEHGVAGIDKAHQNLLLVRPLRTGGDAFLSCGTKKNRKNQSERKGERAAVPLRTLAFANDTSGSTSV